MIRHRDGIVGAWAATTNNAAHYALDDVNKNFERWDPMVRAAILDFELISHLHVTKSDETLVAGGATSNGVVTLWHVELTGPTPVQGAADSPPSGSCERIASFNRPDEAKFRKQLELVAAYADLREDRASEILAQLGPPIAFWSSVANLHPVRNRWTVELLDAALRLAKYAEMRLKHALACRRPVEYSPQVQPMILTPGHGSLPSGHSTEAHLIAYLLWKLLEEAERKKIPDGSGTASRDAAWREQLMRQAARIAINRTVAGVHFPVDSSAGQLLGLTLGEYLVHRCDRLVEAKYAPWYFDGSRFGENQDFVRTDLYGTDGTRQAPIFVSKFPDVTLPAPPAPPPSSVSPPSPVLPLPHQILCWLWNKARDELAHWN
jgi:membrane-associated phospholipid phosphatase